MAIDVEKLFREHRDHLVAAVQRRFAQASRATVEEACAETWLIAWRHRDAVSDETAFAWLFVVARNVMLEVLRKRGGEQLDDEAALARPAAAADPELVLEAREALAAVAALKPQQRRALALQVAGLSYAEIQELDGVTQTWVNRHISEGRAALRAIAETGVPQTVERMTRARPNRCPGSGLATATGPTIYSAVACPCCEAWLAPVVEENGSYVVRSHRARGRWFSSPADKLASRP